MFSCRVAAGYCRPCQRADGLSAHCFGFSDSGDQAASVKGRSVAYRLVYRCAISIEQEAALLACNAASFMRGKIETRQESQLEGLSSVSLRLTAPSAESVKGDFASAEARRWTEPVWQLSDRPRHPFGSLTLLLGSNPTLAGRGGSVSRRDHNQATGNRAYSQAEPTQKKGATQAPAALRERGSGGEALLSEKRPLPQNLPPSTPSTSPRLCR